MQKRYSVAGARQNFANVIASAEHGGIVEITRHGRPVAIVISAAHFAGMTREMPTFADALRDWRARHDVAHLAIDENTFADLRDRSPGRTSPF